MMSSRYPILFSIVVCPFSVLRLLKLRNSSMPISNAEQFIAYSPIALSGALNAVLYLVTRRRLLWGGSRCRGKEIMAHELFHVDEQANDRHSR
jgi:hypothetical protein